jgi:predicted amidohydrolase
MSNLTVSLIQADIAWENKDHNFKHFGSLLKGIAGKTDLAILPEMFSTGFSVQSVQLAESNEGQTVQVVYSWAKEYNFAISGSFLAKDHSGRIFNRGFFITPQGDSWFYDKRHLFRFGGEDKHFSAGEQTLIVPYKGWNIMMIICYDLRFPAWCRNRNNEYDLLVCPANWPESRANVWDVLLKARSMENLSYVCGVNRMGIDGFNIPYKGCSAIIDFKGNTLVEASEYVESVVTETLNKEKLIAFRNKFPAWKDADIYEIK